MSDRVGEKPGGGSDSSRIPEDVSLAFVERRIKEEYDIKLQRSKYRYLALALLALVAGGGLGVGGTMGVNSCKSRVSDSKKGKVVKSENDSFRAKEKPVETGRNKYEEEVLDLLLTLTTKILVCSTPIHTTAERWECLEESIREGGLQKKQLAWALGRAFPPKEDSKSKDFINAPTHKVGSMIRRGRKHNSFRK